MSNFRIRSFKRPRDEKGNPLAWKEVENHIRAVEAAKGNTAGFPISSLLPPEYVSTNEWGLDMDAVQTRRTTVYWSIDRLGSNHWPTYARFYEKSSRR